MADAKMVSPRQRLWGIENLIKRKTAATVIVVIALSLTSAISAEDIFRWGEETPSGVVAQSSSGRPLKVTDEHPVTVFFSFRLKGGVSKVRFLISKSDRAEGITLLEETVNVKDNMAASRLLLNIHRGTPLGRHDLFIQVVDAEKNVKICTGKIPYILLPAGTECMCQMISVKGKSEKHNTLGGVEYE